MKKFDFQKHKFKLALALLVGAGIVWILSSMFFNVSAYGINVTRILRTISYVTIGLLLVMFAFSIYQIVTIKRTRKILYPIVVVFVIVVMVLNYFVPAFAPAINRFVGINSYDKAAASEYLQEARDLTETIEAEGIVMLENKENTLPIATGKINVFGYTSNSVVYGGTGSGGGAEGDNVSLYTALQENGFEINNELVEFYKDRYVARADVDIHHLVGGDFNVHEPALTEYSDQLLANAQSFSDTAVVVFSRHGGEGADLPKDTSGYLGGSSDRNALELSESEEALLNMVKEKFGKVVVLINATNQMELGFLEDEGVDAALWIGYPGSTGFNSVAKVLNGSVNPSGRLVSTYAYELESAATYFNTGEFPYTNTDFEYDGNTIHYKYLNYQEGIYVGYRYYETRFVDNITGIIDEDRYQNVVQYPFGYGLSYTTFTQEIESMEVVDGNINVSVKVTNTGDKTGKEVVQLYYTAPYTIGGIEKSHVVLAAFDKTDELAPNASQTIKLSYKVEDMASYDYAGNRAYILEKGLYDIKLMNNAHDVIDSRSYSVENNIVYDASNVRESDDILATNQFDDALGDVVYLSRADWEHTFPTDMAQPKEAPEELHNALKNETIVVDENADPIVFAKNGLTLADMKGLAYDDAKWELLLQQLSVKDMEQLITMGGFLTVALDSIEKPATIDTDGPAGVNDIFGGLKGNQYTSEVVLASTWNKDLAHQMGETMAHEAKAMNMTGLYMPGVNLHRSPLGGRNFEYYSEDALLSGHIGGSAIQGVRDVGLYSYLKHYAMYDTETEAIRIQRVPLCGQTNNQCVKCTLNRLK